MMTKLNISINFKLLFIALILFSSCSNYNSIQYSKENRISKSSLKNKQNEKELLTSETPSYDLYADADIEDQNNQSNEINNDDKLTLMVNKSKQNSIKSFVKIDLKEGKSLNRFISKSHKKIKSAEKNKSALNIDEEPKSHERNAFDIMHWIILGFSVLLFSLITVSIGFLQFFFIIPIFFLSLLVLILSIIQNSINAKKVLEAEQDQTFSKRVTFAKIMAILSVVAMILALAIGLFILFLLILFAF